MFAFFRAIYCIFSLQCVVFFSESKESGNLFFCFRWLLLTFKREFSFENTMILWEVIKHLHVMFKRGTEAEASTFSCSYCFHCLTAYGNSVKMIPFLRIHFLSTNSQLHFNLIVMITFLIMYFRAKKFACKGDC